MNHLPNTGPHGRRPIPRSGSHDATSSEAGPHPRHPRSLHDRWHITGTEYHHDYEFHLVDDRATDDYDPAPDHNDNGPQAGHRESTASTSSDSLPTRDRRSDREALVPLRTRRRPVGDRNRMARVQLPTRRSEPGLLFQCHADGLASTCRVLRSGRLSGLVRSQIRCRGEHCGSCTALRVVWFVTLATLTWVVL